MFVDEFSAKIWADKYQYKGETFSGFCHRVSSNVFPDDEEREKDLNALLLDFRVMFGGRINSNIGVDEKGLTLFNCFIESINKNPDSLEGIMEMITNYVLTLKTEGGVGFCADFFRPSKTIIRKIGVASPGSIKFLEMFDKASEIITSGSVDKDDCYQGTPTKNSIRKGATMVTMSISHPDIEEFITAKSTPNKLTKMNMSVLVTDDFMEAVKSDADWDLWFPDINYEKYDEEWDGNLSRWKKKGNPIVVYKTVRAADLWDLIMKSSFNRNEPGILFIDNARKMNNISYLNGEMLSSNPCGEVVGVTGIEYVNGEPVELGDVCNLASINLPKFYDAEENKFCVTEFKEAIDVVVRSLENIIDISGYPLDIYEKAAKLKRKIGIGVMGVGSLMMMMNLRYGSEECIDVLGAIMSEFINQAYRSSALLAKDKGPFELYSPELLDLGYVKHGKLNKGTVDLIKMHGLRHSALSAIAPNGTLSIVAGNVSGGVEPVFAREFSRWNRVEGKSVDFKYPNIHKGEWFETDYLKEDKVADEVVLYSTDNKYRIDKNTGLCERVTIMDYGYRIAKEKGYTETATAMELNVDEHLNVLKLLSLYVDQSSSKTINLPNDITLEDFKSLYGQIHSYGIKGCTTYREGTSVAVLEVQKKEKEKSVKVQQEEFLEAFREQEDGIIMDNVKLPDEYPAKGYIIKSEGNKKFYLHVAFKDLECTKPFALFVSTNNVEDNVVTYNALEKLEEVARFNNLREDLIEDVKKKSTNQKNQVKICRMLGLLLRHNVEVITIVKGLDELMAGPWTFVFRIKKFLSQFVEDHEVDGMVCPECGEKSIRFTEGCYSCTCGYSKCG